MKKIIKTACIILAVTVLCGVVLSAAQPLLAKSIVIPEYVKQTHLRWFEQKRISIAKLSAVEKIKAEKPTKKQDTFKDEEELFAYVKEHFYSDVFYEYRIYNSPTSVDGIMPESAAVADASMTTGEASNESGLDKGADYGNDVSSTNTQTEGIDEGDIVKTDGEYIYILRENELIIADAKTDETKILSYYKIFANGDGSANEMYIKGDKAVIVGTIWVSYKKPDYELHDDSTQFGMPEKSLDSTNDFDGDNKIDATIILPDPVITFPIRRSTGYAAVFVIDISDREKPVEISKTMVEGSLLSSREANGKIYLVANKYFNWFYGVMPTREDILPYIIDGKNGEREIEASEIVKPSTTSPSSSVMTIASVDYLGGTETQTMTILGNGSDIYMTAESLYIFGNDNYYGNNTTVAKYSVGDTVEYVASVKVPGWTATDFSYNEYNGEFRIATTDSSSGDNSNNVYVYDENLVRTGSLTGLAKGERIYSARFMGDTLYLVTFRQVDPLFVIDMSGDDPIVLGELKVPGFSTYLHPVGDGLLLGIGKETKENIYTDYYGEKYTTSSVVGLKISLFDVSDPLNPKELDTAAMVGGEYASAAAQDNYKAFTYSDRTKTGYFAIDMQTEVQYDEYGYYYSNESHGFVAVKVDNGRLNTEIAVPSDGSHYGSYSSRVIYIGNNLYFYQYNRVTRFDRETLKELESVIIK